jgi:hypothetical protein
LFFQSSGELLIVWEKVRGLVPGFRGLVKNPQAWGNLESVGNAYIKHVEARGPEAYAAFQGMVKSVSSAASAAKP